MQNINTNQPIDASTTHDSHNICGGCSPFFINSSFLSLITGKLNRDGAMANAKDDKEFSELLQANKEKYEDWKEAEDRAIKLWLRSQQRNFARKVAYEKLNNDLAEADLKMFFADWPLQISVEALLNGLYQSEGKSLPMRFIIGQLYAGGSKDALSSLYQNIVDNVTTLLKEMGLKDNNVYRFKESPTVVDGPALANIYAIMSTYPVTVIMPAVDSRLKKILFNVGCWTPDSPFPYQKNVLSIDFNRQKANSDKVYLKALVSKFTYACATIAAVLHDTYNLSEGISDCVFPKFAAAKALRIYYPELANYAVGEFRALANPTIEVTLRDGTMLNVWDEIGKQDRNKTEKIVKESIAIIEG